jgi:hypothetical protein
MARVIELQYLPGEKHHSCILGKQENSNREGFPAYVADRLTAMKWHNWKTYLI